MRRTFHCLNPHLLGAHDENEALVKAQALAAIAGPDFLELIREVRLMMDAEGGSLYLWARREKIDAEGEPIPGGPPRSEQGEARRLAPGRWRTVSIGFELDDVKGEVPNKQEPAGLVVATLAHDCDADFLDAVLAMKAALDYFGGQVWIVAHREEDVTEGYLFSYEHRDSELVALPEPEPWVDPVEDPPPPDKPRPEENDDLRDEIEAEVEQMEKAEVASG